MKRRPCLGLRRKQELVANASITVGGFDDPLAQRAFVQRFEVFPNLLLVGLALLPRIGGFILTWLEYSLSSILEPGQCDCHRVFAEGSAVADRAIALVFQLSIRAGREPHAIALGALDVGANLVFISVEQPNRAIVEVGLAARKRSGVCQLLNGVKIDTSTRLDDITYQHRFRATTVAA